MIDEKEEKLRAAFSKIRQDMDSLKQEINEIKENLSKIMQLIEHPADPQQSSTQTANIDGNKPYIP